MRRSMHKVLVVIWIVLQTLVGRSATQPNFSYVGRMTREYAACAGAGRMPNSAAESCETYFLCAVNADGMLTVALAHCPLGTVFSPDKLQCVSESAYACPEASAVAKVAPVDEGVPALMADEPVEFQCEQVGRYVNPESVDCKTYYLCTRSPEGVLLLYVASCPGETVFSPELATCVASPPGTCSYVPQTTESPGDPTMVPAITTTQATPFVCPGVGRFPNALSTDCSAYYLCIYNANEVLIAIPGICTQGMAFSPEANQCVGLETYTCPTATTDPSVTTTMAASPFVCPGVGRFPNAQSTDCSAYYLCIYNANEVLIAIPGICAQGMAFSPEANQCVGLETYTCPTATTDPSITTTMAALPFVCPGVGRFPNAQSTDCSAYYLCIYNANEVLIAIPGICAQGMAFSPEAGQCIASETYTCPAATTEPSVTTTMEPSTVSEPATTVEASQSTTEPATTTTEEPTTTEESTASTEEPTTTEESTATTEEPTTTEESTASTEEPTTTEESTATTEEPTTTEESTASTEEPTTTEESTATTEEPTTTEESTATTEEPTTTEESTATTEEPTTTEESTATTEEPTTTEESTATTEEPTTTEESTATTTTTELPTEDSNGEETTTAEPASTTLGSIDGSITPGASTEVPTTPKPFVCLEEGRYPDPDAIACESYMLCVPNSIGTLTAVRFPCPETAIFSEAIRMCVSASTYSCGRVPPTEPTSTTTPPIDTTITTVANTLPTTSVTPLVPRPFVCPSYGRHANPDSIYCKSYYLCLPDTSNQLYAIELSCPKGSIFREAELRCVPADEYTCVPASTTTTTPTTTTTTAPTTTTTERPVPQCLSAGKFPATQFLDCQSYIYCIRLATGGFLQNVFRCPAGTLFDEEKLSCSTSYVCPR
ncbi:hypothetical protein ZHAS_00006249 [Anopheles sinensis]|uniref:Chitin-binding type-2 domain-containing protein n=1 Tax=Anopheles sinensis TaxID=74873 RepID=A0A084VLT3_ANOSI|nr:hypothetical protein ZHAS_00006249 [Anopheles sinensis]